jgi:hypothetical protein
VRRVIATGKEEEQWEKSNSNKKRRVITGKRRVITVKRRVNSSKRKKVIAT